MIIQIGQESHDINEKANYTQLKNELDELGFTNIHLQRADDLLFAASHRAGKVKEIMIDGNTVFSAVDAFKYDVEIVVIVYTKKGKGCEDIKEIAEKQN